MKLYMRLIIIITMMKSGNSINNLIKIVCGDPARRNDAFGIIGIQSDIINDTIRIGLAKQFFNQPYSIVANYFTKIKNNLKPDFIGIETNYRGEKLLQLFNYKYNLDIKGIHTSANLTEKTRQTGKVMDKSYMIKWFIKHKLAHKIKFPEILTPEMITLTNQMNDMIRIPTQTGYTYKAQKGRHDDLFMALLLCCHIHVHYREKMLYNE